MGASPLGSLLAVGLGAVPSFPAPRLYVWVSWASHSPVGGPPLPELAKVCLCVATMGTRQGVHWEDPS